MADPRTSEDWQFWPTSERVCQLARYLVDELQVAEIPRGSNWGHYVESFLAVCGIDFPAPWCIALQMWLLLECGVPDSNLPPKAIRASTQETAHYCREHGGVILANPERGDIFLHLNSDGTTGHAGLFLGLLPGGLMRTIEGNTNDDGGREGDAMHRRDRPLSYATLFLRLR